MKFLDQAIVNVHARRAPQGARGLKSPVSFINRAWSRRAPQGARGLKCNIGHKRTGIDTSRPARGAWVEIRCYGRPLRSYLPSRPARGAWVEIFEQFLSQSGSAESRPARGAWVEIAQKRRRYAEALSRPARGAWVEMNTAHQREVKDLSRAPQGARGLKLFLPRILRSRLPSRAPQGARGLKFTSAHPNLGAGSVAPRNGRVG